MNMWRKSEKRDKNCLAAVASQDLDHDLFDLSSIIKDPHAVNLVKDVIRANWNVFYVNFMEKMTTQAGMDSYPVMIYNTAMSYADSRVNDAFSKVLIIKE